MAGNFRLNIGGRGFPGRAPSVPSKIQRPTLKHDPGVLENVGGRLDNNRMERYQGALNERTRVMRALKNSDTAILDGQRIYYDYIRPHQGLDGKTPAQAAGLDLELDKNKCESLIRRARTDKR